MVTQLQPDVRAYLHGAEVIKRYIRVTLSRYFYTDYMVCDYGIYHHSVWGYSPSFHD